MWCWTDGSCVMLINDVINCWYGILHSYICRFICSNVLTNMRFGENPGRHKSQETWSCNCQFIKRDQHNYSGIVDPVLGIMSSLVKVVCVRLRPHSKPYPDWAVDTEHFCNDHNTNKYDFKDYILQHEPSWNKVIATKRRRTSREQRL